VTGIRQRIVASINRRAFYGWTMVGVASAGVFASGPGQSHTFSVFIKEISQDLGVSSTSIATAYGLATLVAALLLPRMGHFIDRFGPRRMLAIITLVLGGACMLFGAAANILWLAIGFAFLRFFGQGSLVLGCANLMAHWFVRRRGFAVSLMSLGFGVSMAVHPPLSQYLIETVGWRETWFWLGVSTWLLMLPAVLLLIVNRPEDIGTKPDGDSQNSSRIHEKEHDPQIPGLSRTEALREPSFYILGIGCFSISMLVTTLHFYQVSILTSQGLDSEFAAQIFTISAVAMIASMPVVGYLFDNVPTRYVFSIGLLITTGSLVGVTSVNSTTPAIFYAMWFGLNNAFGMTIFGYIWPRFFGRRHIGSIQGTGQLIGVVGASLGPLPVGMAFDLLGSAETTLQILALIPLLCAALALFLRTPKALGDQGRLG
jgi:sugar phosphate permease